MNTARKKTIELFNDIPQGFDVLNDIYAPEATFVDPVGTIQGREKIKSYFEEMYENIISIHFDFHDFLFQESKATVTWTMNFQSSSLKGGSMITVEGISMLEFEEDSHRIIYHRDYFDLAEMVYENIPILGSLIRFIKNKLKHD